jgi:hypothetical protein
MKTALIIISSILTVGSAIPYVIEILKGKTKPRIVSWFTWSLLTGIAFAASWADKQYPSAILMLAATIETLIIVILGLRFGNRRLEPFDIVCQFGAIVGLVLWLLLDSPAIAVAATVAIDLIGALPTIKHAWQKPSEETALTFFMACIGGLCTVLIAGDWKITAVAYPLYITLCNALLVVVILGRNRKFLQGEPAELRKL